MTERRLSHVSLQKQGRDPDRTEQEAGGKDTERKLSQTAPLILSTHLSSRLHPRKSPEQLEHSPHSVVGVGLWAPYTEISQYFVW